MSLSRRRRRESDEPADAMAGAGKDAMSLPEACARERDFGRARGCAFGSAPQVLTRHAFLGSSARSLAPSVSCAQGKYDENNSIMFKLDVSVPRPARGEATGATVTKKVTSGDFEWRNEGSMWPLDENGEPVAALKRFTQFSAIQVRARTLRVGGVRDKPERAASNALRRARG